ncbi:MAG TPA: protein kinase, partial [Ktedonobacterales bacterium]|nr:protein kinase [Ktedonobacterales bacterium]
MAGLEGTQLGSCRMLYRIGGGGMGDIYLADQPGLGRQVAVKVVRGESSPVANDVAQAQAHQQFLQEAQAIATLDHPNILPVYEYGEQQGIHYLVMPFIASGSLADLLIAGNRPGGAPLSLPMAPALASHIISQTAEALQYAHDHGVIHRDVKPQNLLVRLLRPADTPPGAPFATGGPAASANMSPESMQILLADFGLARFMALLVGRTGTIGTPLYSAPEQYSGFPVPATDQYALAGIAFLLLTGRYVFNGTVVELHHLHLTVMPTPPTHINPALPPAVDTMLLRALAKDPAQRFPSVREFARGLHSALTGTSIYPAWSQPPVTGAPPATIAPSPAPASSLMLPTPNAFGNAYSPPPQGMDTPYQQTPGATGAPFAPPPGLAPMPTGAPVLPQYGMPPAPPAGAYSAPPLGPYPAPANTSLNPAFSPSGAPGAQPRPFVPTTPRSPAPAPHLTPNGPWRAEADAPGAPVPRRPKSVVVPFRGPVQLSRKVLLIGLAAVLVLASLSGLALHFLGSSVKHINPVTSIVLQGASGTQGRTIQVASAGDVTLSSLTPLSGAPRAESALSAHSDQADAKITHLSSLPAMSPTVPGFAASASTGANQSVTTPRLALVGASQLDVGVKAPMNVSVGANGQYVVEALDGLIHIASSDGTPNVTRNIAAADIFSRVLHGSDLLGQPRVFFDQAAGRWLIVFDELAVSNRAVTASYLDLAISQGTSPLASWHVYQLPEEIAAYAACTWGDFPQIGSNTTSYYLTASIFACGVNGAFEGTVLWDMPKSAVSAGRTAALFQWTGFQRDNHRPVYSLSPAVETGATTTEWLVSNDAGYVDKGAISQRVNVWGVVRLPISANGTQTIALARASVNLPYPYAEPPAASQPGTAFRLTVGDARIESVYFAGGHLYAAFTTAVNWSGESVTRSAVYWLDLGPAANSQGAGSQSVTAHVGILQAGVFGFAGGYTFYPSIVADSVGNVVLATGAASATMGPSIVLGSRKKADPKNTLDANGKAQLIQRGSKPFFAGPWGDYSSMCLLDSAASTPTTIWFAGAYTDKSPASWRTGLWQFSVNS